jgi:general secretion pathway protein G
MQTQRARSGPGAAGFTLAELMVVIVIIGLLATLVVPNVLGRLARANLARATADIVTITRAIEGYAVENAGRFPESLEALVTPDARGHTFLGRETLPVDPWGTPYLFEPPTTDAGKYRVISYGKDGQPGGTGDDADLDNVRIRNGEV